MEILTMSRRVLRRTAPLAAALALGLGLASASAARATDFDLRLGVYTDVSEAFVGGGILTRLGDSGWFLNPNLEYVFVDRGDLATLNADFHYDLVSEGEVDVWLGAGPALIFRDNDRGNDSTDLGVNLLGGIGFLRDRPIRPFLQAKLVLSDDTEGVVAFGVRFD